MYAVSDDYLAKLFSVGVKRRRIKGTVGGTEFTQDDILLGSLDYSNKCASSADIKLGGVNVGQLNITFLRAFADGVTRGTWKGKEIDLSIGLEVTEGEYEYVPFQPFFVDEANHTQTGVEVTAYDAMTLLDRSFGVTDMDGTLYSMASLTATTCGVTLAQTEDEFSAMPNGEYTFALYPDHDITTWRDLVSWIAVTMGGYATINRDGALEFHTWHSAADLTITQNYRFAGGSWSDFTTYFTGLSIVNIAEQTTSYYAEEGDTGLTMNLGSNPLMQYGTDDTKTTQRTAILTALQNFKYVPFKCSSFADPCIDLGDVISFTGGLADDASVSCVMSIAYGYQKGMTLQGYGKNPALFGAQSKTDKDISGLASSASSQEMVIHTYLGATEVTLGDGVETSVAAIRFTTVKSGVTINIWHEILLDITQTDTTQPVTCQATYYLDGVAESYSPVTTWTEGGAHLLTLLYFITGTSLSQHLWNVRLTLTNATGTIAVGNVHAVLQAQGLQSSTRWDGYLELEDTIPTAITVGIPTVTITDEQPLLTTQTPISAGTLSDSVTAPMLGLPMAAVQDSGTIRLDLAKAIFAIVSEDGSYNVTSEDSAYNIVNER